MSSGALPTLMLGAFLAAGPKYPADLVLDPDERWIFTANEEASSVSMLDRATGAVLGEAALEAGSRPRSIAACRETPADGASPAGASASSGATVAVAETFHHRVAILSAAAADAGAARPSLTISRRLDAGRLPAALVFIDEGRRLLAACEGESEVWCWEVSSARPPRRIRAVEGARRLAVIGRAGDAPGAAAGATGVAGAPGGGRTLVAVAGRTQLEILDVDAGQRLACRDISEGMARNLDGLISVGGRIFIAHQIQPTYSPIDPQMIEWGLVIANRLTMLTLDGLLAPPSAPPAPQTAEERIEPLDLRHLAAGDPGSPAYSERAGALVVPSGGTDRLIFVDVRERFYSRAQPFAAYSSLPDLVVGDRPVSVKAAAGGERVYVACYLDDAVVEVDPQRHAVTRTLRLAPPPDRTPEHRGAEVFYDSRRSRGGWYSCHSCHPQGGTAGHSFNTLADGRGLAKRTPPLYEIDRTSPWAWIGKFESLEAQVAASLQKTMAVDHAPRPEDVEDVLAFIRTVRRPDALRPGEELGADPLRGARLFEEAGCSECHAPPYYTTPTLRDVGLEAAFDGTRKYNPPSLLGVRDRFRWLHDGRAESLEAVFRDHDKGGRHGGASRLDSTQLRDLLAFLKTL